MRGLLSRLALLIASIAGSLLLAEGAVRLVAPQQLVELRPDIWQPDDGLGYIRQSDLDTTVNAGEGPVTLRTDAHGHRVGAEDADAQHRILAIGDSFVAALGVEHEDTFAARLDAPLSAAAGAPVRVVNAGVSGHGPSHYLINARRELARTSYDGVLVFIYVLNDTVARKVEHYDRFEQWTGPQLRMPESMEMVEWNAGLIKPAYMWLRQRSHLAVLVKSRLIGQLARLGIHTELWFPREIIREYMYAAEWQVTAEILGEIARLTPPVPTVYVLIPSRFQIQAELAYASAEFYGLVPAQLDLEQPNRRLREELETLGLDVVDTLPTLRARYEAGDTLYGNVDSHLSPAGHAAVADATAAAAAAAFGYREGDP